MKLKSSLDNMKTHVNLLNVLIENLGDKNIHRGYLPCFSQLETYWKNGWFTK